MVVKVYISGMSGSKEVKKRQQRVTMIMDSKHIEYSIIDITEPGQEGEKDFMQTNAAHKGCTISDPNPRHALPPQLFNDTEYCGDYDDFDLANEVDSLEVFLKVAAPVAPVAPVAETAAEHKNGDVAAAAADDENKENKTEANKDDNDDGAAGDAEDDATGDAVDGPNEVTVEQESTSQETHPEANGQPEGVDEEANSKLVTDNDATKDDPPQSEVDKEPDGSTGEEENSETLPAAGPDEETSDTNGTDERERGEAAENEPQKDDRDVEDDGSEEHGSQAKEEPAPGGQTSERLGTDEPQQDADSEAHENDAAEAHPAEPEDPVERMELAAEPEEQVTVRPGEHDADDGSDDDRSQSRRSSTDEQEEIEDPVRSPNAEERPSSPAAASKGADEVRPVARGDGTMEADASDTEEQEMLRASAALLAGQSEDAQEEIIEVDDEPLEEEAEDTAEQQTTTTTGAGEEDISSKLVDTDDPMLAEQEQEE